MGNPSPHVRRALRPWLPNARGAIHLALCAVLAWLALLLSAPGDTFPTSVSYRVMAAVASEPRWALAFWAGASVGAFGLATPCRVLRLACVLVLASLHGAVALCFALSNPMTTASGTYAVLAGLGCYLAWRQADEGL